MVVVEVAEDVVMVEKVVTESVVAMDQEEKDVVLEEEVTVEVVPILNQEDVLENEVVAKEVLLFRENLDQDVQDVEKINKIESLKFNFGLFLFINLSKSLMFVNL